MPNTSSADPPVIPLDAKGWPLELIFPTKKEFWHGTYRPESRYRTDEIRDYECGTGCCLLGWISIAFRGERYDSGVKREPTKAETKFAREFLKAAGWKGRYTVSRGPVAEAEAVFEGFGDYEGLTEPEAARYWRQAAEACGYDVAGAKR